MDRDPVAALQFCLALRNEKPHLSMQLQLSAAQADLLAQQAALKAVQSGDPNAGTAAADSQVQAAQGELAAAQQALADARQVQAANVGLANAEVQATQATLDADQQLYNSSCSDSESQCLGLSHNLAVDKGQVAVAKASQAKVNAESTKATNAAAQLVEQRKLELGMAQQRKSAVADPATQLALTQAALARAQATVAANQRLLSQVELKAPVAGVITAINGTVGQIADSHGVQQYPALRLAPAANQSGIQLPSAATSALEPPAAPLIQMVDDASWNAVAQVGERDVPRLVPGTSGTVTFRALPGITVKATLRSLSPSPVMTSAAGTGYAALFRLSSVPAGLRPGMSASVTVDR